MKATRFLLGLIFVIGVATAGCKQFHLVVVPSPYSPSRQEIENAVSRVSVGMSARSMLEALVPVASTSPVFKNQNDIKIRYFLGLGKNGQIWIDVENRERKLPIGLGQPNGVVTAIGRIEEKEEWVSKYEDSNELE